MIVASPYYKSLRLADSVYQNTDVLLLRLLKERIVSKDRTTHFFVLMLPYCSEQDIPKEAINLRRYSFPKDINKMLKFIQKDRSITNCLGSKIQGGRETYKLFGGKLNNAITETQVILMSNKSEYDKMVRETKKENSSGDDPLLANGPKREKNGFYEIRSKGKRSVMRLAEDIFSEFPGRLDDMNLSGEEKESMVESQSWSTENEVVNLDALDL